MEVHVVDITNGDHEKCAWCRKPFTWTIDKWERFKALDNKYYCNEMHASAPYLTPRTPRDITGW